MELAAPRAEAHSIAGRSFRSLTYISWYHCLGYSTELEGPLSSNRLSIESYQAHYA